jgi:hypothetical protein
LGRNPSILPEFGLFFERARLDSTSQNGGETGKMERDKRIELSPPPWQGGVLPLYESRVLVMPEVFIARPLTSDKPATKACFGRERTHFDGGRVFHKFWTELAARLIDFHDARGFNDGRFLLALGEAFGAVAVDIDAAEFLTVVVIHGDLPMAVLASAVALKTAGTFRFRLGILFFHDGVALNAPDYKEI